ncbi:MAG TPA: sugar ABC transporter permease [Actinophytocola sp.]|uniref:carbohydrate ABC transporter permease n=1 Tax=Actinophytocola sp. TaxID=1872138 RepID=UPI002DDD1A45|nr:sugar ABC transporter permease [Actinophytocola sp.]HEV2782370.1 sugar ABC transporter permease [Actinophytocola sp.]
MRQGRYRFIIGFLAVPVFLYGLYVIWPFAQAFYLAMTSKRTAASPDRFIGFDNFERLFQSDRFWKAVGHHGVLLLALPLITLAIALFLAYLLNVAGGSRGGGMTGIFGSKVYKVIFFLPQVLAVALVAVLFQAIYRPDGLGALNAVLESVGLGRVGWLLEPNLALWSIIGVLVWQAVGFYVVLFSAGMASIPAEIYESAEMDGCGRFRMFFSVTLPLLWDTLQVAWVYLGIAAFDAFAVVQLLSVDFGGPDGATTVLPLEIWQEAFRNSRFGYASAMGVALFFLTLTFAILALRVTRRERIEY